MVSRAISRCSNTTAPSRTSATAGMQLMGLPAQRLELLARGRAIGRLGEPPLAQRQGLVGAEHQRGRADAPQPPAPSRARAAPRPRRHRGPPRAARSRARRYRPARSRPECRRRAAWRAATALFEASTSGCRRARAASISASRLAAALGQQAQHRRGGLLDRAARHVDLGQLCLAHSLRENATSSATALRSIY